MFNRPIAARADLQTVLWQLSDLLKIFRQNVWNFPMSKRIKLKSWNYFKVAELVQPTCWQFLNMTTNVQFIIVSLRPSKCRYITCNLIFTYLPHYKKGTTRWHSLNQTHTVWRKVEKQSCKENNKSLLFGLDMNRLSIT